MQDSAWAAIDLSLMSGVLDIHVVDSFVLEPVIWREVRCMEATTSEIYLEIIYVDEA